jgi:hypothetical protein
MPDVHVWIRRGLEAADEIERLRAAIRDCAHNLGNELSATYESTDAVMNKVAAEIVHLRRRVHSAEAEIERWKNLYDAEINRVLAMEIETERLKEALKQRDEDHAIITRDLRSEIERLRGK